MNINDIAPLNISIKRGVVDGQLYEIHEYEEFAKIKDPVGSVAILEKIDNQDIVLPYRGKYNGQQSTPGVYNAGCIDFVIKPTEDQMEHYLPKKIVEISNTSSMKEIMESRDVISRMSEPWITTPDNITTFNIVEEDQPEMRCLKTAINCKQIDFDKYSSRFGDNYPNDKRQLKNNSVTLTMAKRFCDKLDMEAILILRDKNLDVPNPMNKEIRVSLTDINSPVEIYERDGFVDSSNDEDDELDF